MPALPLLALLRFMRPTMLDSSLATSLAELAVAIELTLPLRCLPGDMVNLEMLLNAETGEAARLRLERRFLSRGVADWVVMVGIGKTPELELEIMGVGSSGTGVVLLSIASSASDMIGDEGIG